MSNRAKNKLPPGDDGRVIANMNVEGMPWYSPLQAGEARPPEREGADSAPNNRQEERFTKEEARYATWGAVKAALLVVGVICVGLVLFILFCQHVWFR